MNVLKTLTATLLLGGSAAALAADTDTEFHLNELLKSDPQYQETWQDLVEDQERLPEWIMNLDGVAPPMKALEEDGDKFLVGQICPEQNCATQRLYVAFSWDKDSAYALYVQLPEALPKDKAPSKYATQEWLGEPDEGIKEMLNEQLKKDPNWY
ncbi:inhibitor of vertebrate lysozyme family protein [Pseudomonas sp. NPDC078700]|uniref:inhibitor of vertebrate lysozyme family protein n=1 Tax=Pseudomonas sp. NPDC078700 TaxID=3364424 RepID=UPI0037CB0E8B